MKSEFRLFSPSFSLKSSKSDFFDSKELSKSQNWYILFINRPDISLKWRTKKKLDLKRLHQSNNGCWQDWEKKWDKLQKEGIDVTDWKENRNDSYFISKAIQMIESFGDNEYKTELLALLKGPKENIRVVRVKKFRQKKKSCKDFSMERCLFQAAPVHEELTKFTFSVSYETTNKNLISPNPSCYYEKCLFAEKTGESKLANINFKSGAYPEFLIENL
mmetsp:Transcript_163/g.281  ORF Transcript_163/g.281 Transcript_163/m.281 type:complete len:218 (+) Transcript_163:1-654(+)